MLVARVLERAFAIGVTHPIEVIRKLVNEKSTLYINVHNIIHTILHVCT